MEQGKLWHVVLISFRPGIPETMKQNVYSLYQTLGEDCGGKEAGIILWKVNWNLDLRKNVHLVEIAVFENDAAYQAFKTHLKHKELADIVSRVADWQVGNILMDQDANPLS